MGGINLVVHLASLAGVMVFLWWAAHLLRQLRMLRSILQGPSGRLVAMEPVEFAVQLTRSLGKPSEILGDVKKQEVQPLKPREFSYVLQHLEIRSLEARLFEVGSNSLEVPDDSPKNSAYQKLSLSGQGRWCLTWIGHFEESRKVEIEAALRRTFGVALDHKLKLTA